MAEYNFPTETIDLPSEGKFYPEGSPLRNGKIDIKYMTAKEEDILTSTNLIQKGTVLDKLMESIIVTKGVKPDDLLVGDLNAVMVAARILAYGKDYPTTLVCLSCQTKFEHVADLTALGMVSPSATSDSTEYTATLPTGVVVTFKLLTRGEEREVTNEVNSLKKFNGAVEADTTTRLRYMITSVNGNTDKKIIREFSEAIIMRDLRALREEIRKVTPDVDFEIRTQCPSCDSGVNMRMPIGANFFWPDLRV